MKDKINEFRNKLLFMQQSIKSLNESFYKGNIKEGLDKLEITIDMLDAITKIYIEMQPQDYDTIKKINELINELEKSLRNKDYILTADIFNYEMLPITERMEKWSENELV